MAGAKPDANHSLECIGLGKVPSWTCCQHRTECTSFETWLSILKVLMRRMINTSLWQNFIRSDKRQSETCSFIACKILLACVVSWTHSCCHWAVSLWRKNENLMPTHSIVIHQNVAGSWSDTVHSSNTLHDTITSSWTDIYSYWRTKCEAANRHHFEGGESGGRVSGCPKIWVVRLLATMRPAPTQPAGPHLSPSSR